MIITRVGVVGAGIMGSGIAQVCAVAGLSVTIVEIADAALAKGTSAIRSSLEKLVSKEKLPPAALDIAIALISTTTDYAALSSCELVIEAATEDREIKKGILKRVDSLLQPSAILATNTSSLSITGLAAGTTRPDRFGGLHFFNPVPVMALVEVIRGLGTSEDTQQILLNFATRIGKTPIAVRNSGGFAVNRILCPMINEAIFALQDGVASADDIDAGMRLGCNHPIGPLALADMIGLDTLLHRDPRSTRRYEARVQKGRLGNRWQRLWHQRRSRSRGTRLRPKGPGTRPQTNGATRGIRPCRRRTFGNGHRSGAGDPPGTQARGAFCAGPRCDRIQ